MYTDENEFINNLAKGGSKRLSDEERRDLYLNLAKKKQGMSGTQRGALAGGVADALSKMITAGTRVDTSGAGDAARQIGAAQDQRDSEQVARWKQLLKLDEDARQFETQDDRLRSAQADQNEQARAARETANRNTEIQARRAEFEGDRLDLARRRDEFERTQDDPFTTVQGKEGTYLRDRQGNLKLVDQAAPAAPSASAGKNLKQERMNYQMGVAANDQYEQAAAKGKDSGDWDPTKLVSRDNIGKGLEDYTGGLSKMIRPDAAIEAAAAAQSWVETFLREVSGAAIGIDERAEFKDIFFPAAGDTEQTVKNKARLRELRMSLANPDGSSAGDLSKEDQEILANAELTLKQRLDEIRSDDSAAVREARKILEQNPSDPTALRVLEINGAK